jgi:WD40 repeat protein
VTSVTFSHCGKWVVSGSKDGTVRLWAAANGKAIEPTLADHEGPVRCVALSPDDKHIASGSEDRTILLWEANWAESSFKRTGILRGHAGTIHSVAFSSDGKMIVSGSLDATIRLWDLESGCIKNVLRATDDVLTVAFSPNDQSIMAALYDFSLRLWDVNSPITEKESGASTIEGSPLSCNWSRDGKRLALGFTSGSIEIVDGKSYQPIVNRFRGHSGPVYSVTFSSDDRYIVSSSHDRTVRQWDASSGQALGKVLVGHENRVFCAAYSLDAKRIVSCSEDQTVRIWNAEDGTQIGDSILHDTYVYSVAYSPDGLYVASGADSALRIWDVQSRRMFAEVSKNTHWVTSVEYLPDGRHLLATAIDGKPLYWSMERDAPEDLDRFSRSILYDLDRGWLRDVDGRILCWLPSGYRNDFRPGVYGKHLLATPNVTLKEGFTIFDLSRALRGPKEGR